MEQKPLICSCAFSDSLATALWNQDSPALVMRIATIFLSLRWSDIPITKKLLLGDMILETKRTTI